MVERFETITYALYTPRASGAVTFRNTQVLTGSESRAGEFLIAHETAPYFRKAFEKMKRWEAVAHWKQKGYSFSVLPKTGQ